MVKFTVSNPLGSSIETSELSNDSVGYAKLNSDIVGIDTTTGKINTINSTNFKSLDGSNLTGLNVNGVLATSGKSTATASFSTSSTTFVDVTNPATLTLSGLTSGNTYTVLAWASVYLGEQNQWGYIALNINGNDQTQVLGGSTSVSAQPSVSGVETGITGVTSVDVKLRMKTETASSKSIDYTSTKIVAEIVAIAIKTG